MESYLVTFPWAVGVILLGLLVYVALDWKKDEMLKEEKRMPPVKRTKGSGEPLTGGEMRDLTIINNYIDPIMDLVVGALEQRADKNVPVALSEAKLKEAMPSFDWGFHIPAIKRTLELLNCSVEVVWPNSSQPGVIFINIGGKK